MPISKSFKVQRLTSGCFGIGFSNDDDCDEIWARAVWLSTLFTLLGWLQLLVGSRTFLSSFLIVSWGWMVCVVVAGSLEGGCACNWGCTCWDCRGSWELGGEVSCFAAAVPPVFSCDCDCDCGWLVGMLGFAIERTLGLFNCFFETKFCDWIQNISNNYWNLKLQCSYVNFTCLISCDLSGRGREFLRFSLLLPCELLIARFAICVRRFGFVDFVAIKRGKEKCVVWKKNNKIFGVVTVIIWRENKFKFSQIRYSSTKRGIS